MGEIPAELSDDDLVRIWKMSDAGVPGWAMRDYAITSQDVLNTCIEAGKHVAAQRDEGIEYLRDSWPWPSRRPVPNLTRLSLTEALTWLALGVAMKSDDFILLRGCAEKRAFFTESKIGVERAWEEIRTELSAGRLAAFGCKWNRAILTHESPCQIDAGYFTGPVFPSLNASNSIEGDILRVGIEGLTYEEMSEWDRYDHVSIAARDLDKMGERLVAAPRKKKRQKPYEVRLREWLREQPPDVFITPITQVCKLVESAWTGSPALLKHYKLPGERQLWTAVSEAVDDIKDERARDLL